MRHQIDDAISFADDVNFLSSPQTLKYAHLMVENLREKKKKTIFITTDEFHFEVKTKWSIWCGAKERMRFTTEGGY